MKYFLLYAYILYAAGNINQYLAPALGIEPSSHGLTVRSHTLCVSWNKQWSALIYNNKIETLFELLIISRIHVYVNMRSGKYHQDGFFHINNVIQFGC